MKHAHEDEDAFEVEQPPKRLRTENLELEPSVSYPFYYYHDFSNQPDPDPSVQLTAPGRVPNFPAKMHAILSREDLNEIIGWMPHGRAWKVFKPREFEVLVLPTYFEHSKFSSFIRQANGWGFRRINAGRDRNCYYHPQFLRGLTHLCKGMKRPGVAQKLQANPKHEPDLYKISEFHPVPERSGKESVVLFSTLVSGSKACVSINSVIPQAPEKLSRNGLTPREHEALSAFYASLGSIDGEAKELNQDMSIAMFPTSMAAPSIFQPTPLKTSHQENYVNDFATPYMRTLQSLSDANEMAFCNQPNFIPAPFGNHSNSSHLFSQL